VYLISEIEMFDRCLIQKTQSTCGCEAASKQKGQSAPVGHGFVAMISLLLSGEVKRAGKHRAESLTRSLPTSHMF
jgi:hypothetical protein